MSRGNLAAAVVAALLAAATALAQSPKVVFIGGTAYVDAVRSLGCAPGIGNGAGNAAKINAYFGSRPKYPLYVPGGVLEIDDTIVIPNQHGVPGMVGAGRTANLNDAHYSGSGSGSSPTRIVWAGAADKAMIECSARHWNISHLSLQSRPAPNDEPSNTGIKARIGIHVRTAHTSGIPSGKLELNSLSFNGLPHGILFGRDLDTDLATVRSDTHADETSFHNLHFFFPYTEGYGTGTLSVKTSDSAGVITLGSSGHGITQGNYVDINWSGGSRTGMLVTGVAGAALTVSGGYGANLPSASTEITSCQEERCGMRFRTLQALGFTGGYVQSNGHPESVLWFESGGGLKLQHLSVSGASDATHQTSILKLGRVSQLGYDIGLFLDATTKHMRWVHATEDVNHKTSVVLRATQLYPSNQGTYDVPVVDARGGYVVTLQDFNYIQPGAIKLVGKEGVDPPPPPANGGSRHWVAACHLERCTMQEDMAWPKDALDVGGSSGYHWLTWKNCRQRWNGEFGDGGIEGQPYDDDEFLGGDLSKISDPGP